MKTCSLLLASLCFLSACGTAPLPRKPKLYASSPEKGAIERAQSGEVIGCSSPRFNAFVCMTYEDYVMVRTSSSCAERVLEIFPEPR